MSTLASMYEHRDRDKVILFGTQVLVKGGGVEWVFSGMTSLVALWHALKDF